jgi:hypothetical protein
MATFTSAPIGSTAQSLDGLNVSTAGGPALFLEAVAIGDPTDGGALAPVSSTVGLSVNVASTVAQSVNVSVVANQITSSIPFYVAQSSGPWSVQGTTNVQGTSSVNLLGTASTQIISSIPFYVAQSSAPWTVTATATVQGTSSAQIVSSIPFFVAQSSAPWTVTATATVQGTSSVNVLGNITIQGTSSANILGAIPGTTQVNVVSSLALTIQGTSSVNVLGAIPGTTQVNVVSSLALTIQGTSTAFVRGNAGAIFDAAPGANAPANGLYLLARVSTSNPATVGNASTVALMADPSGSLVVAEGLRTMMSATTVTLASTAAETTIIPATASEFHDITNLYICNASSSAQTLTLRDATTGTIRGVYDFNSTFANPININFVPPLAQSTSNANWTIQAVTSTLFHAKVFVAWVRKPT